MFHLALSIVHFVVELQIVIYTLATRWQHNAAIRLFLKNYIVTLLRVGYVCTIFITNIMFISVTAAK